MSQLTPGDRAPDLTLPSHEGTTVTLVDLLTGQASGQGSGQSSGPPTDGVVVYFYPAAMTPGCTTQACDFRDSLASLQAAGFAVVGVSPDPVDVLARFAGRDALTFPLLSDEDRSTMAAWGAYGQKKLYGKLVTGVIRSTVVVAPDGLVTLARYNVRATGHVAMLRRVLGVQD